MRLLHGYESDDAALRTIASLYSEAAIEAARGRYAGFPDAIIEASRLVTDIWAFAEREDVRVRLERESKDVDDHRRDVAKDIIARLDGDMGRQLPILK